MSISNRLVKHFAACAAAVATVAVVGSANASVVTWNLNMVIPNTFDGLYINVETGGTAGLGGGIPGWDLNPYNNSTTSITWFNAGGTGMYRSATQTGTASVAIGTVIDSTGLFTGGSSADTLAGGSWVLNATNYFGFRFTPAAGGTLYGYGSIDIGAHMGVRFLNFVSFETDPQFGITVVPTPGAIALVGLAGLISRRRRS